MELMTLAISLICQKVELIEEVGKVIINNLTDERSLSIPAHDSQISCMRFNFKGNYFATASKKVKYKNSLIKGNNYQDFFDRKWRFDERIKTRN
jgi:hypothetical protein